MTLWILGLGSVLTGCLTKEEAMSSQEEEDETKELQSIDLADDSFDLEQESKEEVISEIPSELNLPDAGEGAKAKAEEARIKEEELERQRQAAAARAEML